MVLLQVAVVTVAFPATPLLLARARICISASHTREDLIKALEVNSCITCSIWLLDIHSLASCYSKYMQHPCNTVAILVAMREFVAWHCFGVWFFQVFGRVGDLVGIKYFPAQPKKAQAEEERLLKVDWLAKLKMEGCLRALNHHLWAVKGVVEAGLESRIYDHVC